MAALTYDDIYKIAEELGQLKGARVQKVVSSDLLRYELEFYGSELGEDTPSRWLVFDLNPARPLILSISSSLPRKIKKKTPIFNFLNAHFLNARLKLIEVAQKPNRTLKFSFQTLDTRPVLTFKCFPHGQEILLESEGKKVAFPLRPAHTRQSLEDVSFVEPSLVKSWEFNNSLVAEVLVHSKSTSTLKPEPDSYFLKVRKKLERALSNIDESFEPQRILDAAEIQSLQAQAIEIQQQESVDGSELNAIYEKVKKLKKKSELTLARRQDLQSQLELLLSPLGQERFKSQQKGGKKELNPQKPKDDTFSGTKVYLDSKYELWVGRTAWQNDDLLKLASPHDIWIHLRDYAGAHGVLRGPGKKSDPPQALIEFSCRIVAILSQSKKNPFADGQALDFIVTPKKFVKKPRGAAPGRVIVDRESVRRVAFKAVKFEVRGA